MKCPQCKKDLPVNRTFGENTRTVRERKCPKCHFYHKTVEVFETEFSKLQRDLKEAKEQLTLEQYALERELNEMREAARVFVEAARKGKKGG